MNDSAKRVTEKIYMNSRMELEFFMYVPDGAYSSPDKSTISLQANPVLYLRYKQPKNYNSEYDYSKASYKITPKNFYRVVKFFNTMMEWLYGDRYKDIFLYNDEGRLIFNADYKKLSTSMPINDKTQQYMQAIPSVVEIGGKISEGVIIFINNTNYQIPLTYDELEVIFGILKNFRFSEEVTLALSVYRYLTEYNKVQPYMPKSKTPFD